MRKKSMQKFKDRIRQITVRKYNLDAELIRKLNQVIRGTANYFGKPEFSTCRWMFYKLDSWIRMRLRCMRTKRKNYNDNQIISDNWFTKKRGVLTLEEFRD